MRSRAAPSWLLSMLALVATPMPVNAAIYRVLPSAADVTPGASYPMRVEVETQAGDNVVGIGFFSFAIDLSVSGTAGATGNNIGNVVLNESDFDDFLTNSVGHPQGNEYLGIAGVTSNFLAPTFGHHAGDTTWLINFDVVIPLMVSAGDTLTITPSEGAFENLIANDRFNNVAPQLFEATTLTVVPEPASGLLTLIVGCWLGRRRVSLRGAAF